MSKTPSTKISTASLNIVLKTMEKQGTSPTEALKLLVKAGLDVPKSFTKKRTTPPSKKAKLASDIPIDLRGYGQARLSKLDKTTLKSLCKRMDVKFSSDTSKTVKRLLAAKSTFMSESGSDESCSDCSSSGEE